MDSLRAENDALRLEVMRLRDALVGATAQAGAAKGKATELASWVHRYEDVVTHHEEILATTTWRLGSRLHRPITRLKGLRSKP